MEKELFNPMEIDALGEIFNISLGSSATAVANLLDHKVDITTPKVSVVGVKDFSIGNLEPAMGIEIKYVEGLEGSNLMLLRRKDIKVIVDILMGSEMPEEEFELNELTISAVCEVMNQMMGSASTALADFLGFPVNISTPVPFELDDMESFKREHLPQGADTVVVVRFSFKIENVLESEFMNVMSIDLAKELLRGLGLGDDGAQEQAAEQPPVQPAPTPESESSSGGSKMLSQEEIEKLMSSMGAQTEQEATPPAAQSTAVNTAPAAAPAPQAPPMQQPQQGEQGQQPFAQQMPYGGWPTMPGQPMPGQQMPPQGMGMPYMSPMYYPYPQQPPMPQAEPKVIESKPMSYQELNPLSSLGSEQAENLDLIMDVPLQVSVEIGRTRRKVRDILEFTKGSLVVLDKLAGDQVDLFVNGKCIAKGDVVVVDDNFGIRITEIVKEPEIQIAMKKN